MRAPDLRSAKALALSALWLLLPVAGCSAPAKTPNVLLVVIDTLRADALSHAGYARETSPNLDAFAAQSLVFERAVSVSGVTAPAMAAMMSGRLPYYEDEALWSTRIAYGLHRFYASEEESGLPLALETLAERLRDRGYATAGIVTNPHLKAEFQFDQGFDVYEAMLESTQIPPAPYATADEVTRRGIEWLEQPRTAPFFLYLHYMDVHHPYLPPAEHQAHFEFRRVRGESDRKVQVPWTDPAMARMPRYRHIEEHQRGLYDAEIRHVDHWIGVLLEHLETAALADDTLVVVTSDHGEEFFEHGGTLHLGRLYEEHLRVPLLLRVPGRAPGRISHTVRNMDVMPTLLDYCGVELPPDLDAESLRPFIEGHPTARSRLAVASFPTLPGRAPVRMIRTEREKYLHAVARPERSELYDLGSDPAEQVNTFANAAQSVDALRTRLEQAFEKPAREARASRVDFRSLQRDAAKTHEERVRQALERRSPEERARLVREGLSQTASEAPVPPEPAKRLHEGLDPETAEQLRRLGYAD